MIEFEFIFMVLSVDGKIAFEFITSQNETFFLLFMPIKSS